MLEWNITNAFLLGFFWNLVLGKAKADLVEYDIGSDNFQTSIWGLHV